MKNSSSLRALAKQSRSFRLLHILDCRVAALLAMMAISNPALSAGLDAYEVKEIEQYFQTRRTNCQAHGSAANAECWERNALKQHADIAHRTGNVLVLILVDGKKSYANYKSGDDYSAEKTYYLEGYLKPIDAFLVWEQHYEGGRQWLVMRSDGKVIELLGSPGAGTTLRFSPDGIRMLDYNYDEASYTESGIRVYNYDRQRGFSLEPNAKCEIENLKPQGDLMTAWLDSAYWQDNEHLTMQTNFTYKQTCSVTRH